MTEVIREGIGYGYSEKEALSDWLSHDSQFDIYGLAKGHAAIDYSQPVTTKRLKKPRFGKRANVEKFKQSGSRKYKTVYKIVGTENSHIETRDTQAEAIERAKELALENKIEYVILCAKAVVEGNEVVAKIGPGISLPGKYSFSASFKF